jgi:two-component system, chemotaxis family, chemotaxis protein CheY
MKTLIVEDEFTSRYILQEFLRQYGECSVVVNGKEGLLAFQVARNTGQPYDLVLLDILMPDMDGLEALKEIRRIEEAEKVPVGNGVKVVMTTAMSNLSSVIESYHIFCDDYLIKPIDRNRLLQSLKTLGLIEA